jgi:ketosteroid isomerase-like protein
MADDNLAAFHASAEAVNRGDWEAAIRHMAADIVFIPQRAPVEGSYVGHADVRRFAEDTRETFDVFRVSFREVRVVGDRVLALGALRIRGHGSGVEAEVPSAIVATFRDGLMVRFQDFGDAGKALAAVGLDS